MSQGCKRRLASGQHWSFCGETDMGQTVPALCVECGGEFVLADSAPKTDAANFIKVKTAELQGAALDWAVAKCEGTVFKLGRGIQSGRPLLMLPHRGHSEFSPSTNWAQGGPIIERMMREMGTFAFWSNWMRGFGDGEQVSLLVAAMRCYVASKLGAEVEIPEELCAA